MKFKRTIELEAEVLKFKNLVETFEKELKDREASNKAELQGRKQHLEKELFDVHHRTEEQSKLDLLNKKAELEIEFQKRVTEMQTTMFTEMKEMFQKEVDVLKETYTKLIENII